MTLTYSCASCAMKLFPLHATDLIDTAPQFDDILVCGGCGNINRVTLHGTALLSDDEMNKLSEDEQRDLKFAVRAVQKKVRQS